MRDAASLRVADQGEGKLLGAARVPSGTSLEWSDGASEARAREECGISQDRGLERFISKGGRMQRCNATPHPA